METLAPLRAADRQMRSPRKDAAWAGTEGRSLACGGERACQYARRLLPMLGLRIADGLMGNSHNTTSSRDAHTNGSSLTKIAAGA